MIFIDPKLWAVKRVHIYGVEWDWTSSGPTAGTRTDDAVGFDDPQPAVNNGAESFAKINTSQIQYYMIQGNQRSSRQTSGGSDMHKKLLCKLGGGRCSPLTVTLPKGGDGR